jgi:hypothetical protein
MAGLPDRVRCRSPESPTRCWTIARIVQAPLAPKHPLGQQPDGGLLHELVFAAGVVGPGTGAMRTTVTLDDAQHERCIWLTVIKHGALGRRDRPP